MKFSSSILVALSAASTVSTVNAAGVGTFFTYFEDGGLGPSNWAFLAIDGNQCGGTAGQSGYGQSPVTITQDVSNTCDTDMAAYDFNGGDCRWIDLDFTISNNGVKVGPKPGTTCSFGQMNIPHTPNKFNALQFHIHTYSEHEIQGQGDAGFFPAELHVVHQEETEESFAVFGTMIDVGTDDHEMFEWFLQGWEAYAQNVENSCPTSSTTRRQLRAMAEEDEEATFTPVQAKVTCPKIGESEIYRNPFNTTGKVMPIFPAGQAPNVYDLPTDKNFGTFTYKGGLTTPGCTEIVNWNLLDKAMSISANQMSRLESLILCYVDAVTDEDGTTVKSCGHATVADAAGSTSRPPQPLKGRAVTHRCRVGPAVEYVDVGELPSEEIEFVKPAPREEPSNTKEGDCDRAMYEDCSSDPRYNPNVSPNLKSVAPIWNDDEGYWIGTKKAYDAQGVPLKEVFASSEFKSTFPYPQDEILMFVNRTVQETRVYEHTYGVYRPANAEFCTLPVPDFASNKRGAGVCGVNGYAVESEKFGVASFEKDGSANIILASGVFEGTTTGKTLPVGPNSFYKTAESDDFQKVETSTFSNDERTMVTGSGQYFIFSDTLPYSENPLYESYTFVLEQVSKETWEAALQAAYNTANVLQEDRPATGGSDCVDDDICPTEEEWAERDPRIAESPYQEDPKVKGGFIALFVIICISVVLGAAFALHLNLINNQAHRYRETFAKRIAETIEFNGHHEKITPEALEDEFRRMDIDKDGKLSKEEMKQFMGKKMNPADFNAMFAAMDIDHSGSVEFAEFCAFMAHAFSDYDKAADAVASSSPPAPAPETAAAPAAAPAATESVEVA